MKQTVRQNINSKYEANSALTHQFKTSSKKSLKHQFKTSSEEYIKVNRLPAEMSEATETGSESVTSDDI